MLESILRGYAGTVQGSVEMYRVYSGFRDHVRETSGFKSKELRLEARAWLT